MNIEKGPISSRQYFFPANEFGNKSINVSEFKLGEINLHRLAELTKGCYSNDWWVLRRSEYLKNHMNIGNVRWNFESLENEQIDQASVFFSKNGFLVFASELNPAEEISIISQQPINIGRYKAYLNLEYISKELEPSLKNFLSEEDGIGELFIPLPGSYNSTTEFNNMVNCFSISPRSGIRFNSGLICKDNESIDGFDNLMHKGIQKLLIDEHKRYFKRIENN